MTLQRVQLKGPSPLWDYCIPQIASDDMELDMKLDARNITAHAMTLQARLYARDVDVGAVSLDFALPPLIVESTKVRLCWPASVCDLRRQLNVLLAGAVSKTDVELHQVRRLGPVSVAVVVSMAGLDRTS